MDGVSSAVVENLSAGGIFLRTARPLPNGTWIELSLVRPGLKRAITLAGRVVGVLDVQSAAARGVAPGMGIQFSDLNEEAAARLKAVLESLGVKNPFGQAPPAWPPRPDTVEIPALSPDTPALSAEVQLHGKYADSIPDMRPTPTHTKITSPTSPTSGAEPPRPISVEVSLPKFTGDHAGETEKLMNHIRGLLKQLGDREETIQGLERQIEELKGQLDDKDRLIGELMAGKTIL
jgi:uncharacterized protein (TIGR02266 family)